MSKFVIMTSDIVLGLVILTSPIHAQIHVWPQFRGPSGQGIVGNEPLPIEWSEKEHIAWKTPISGIGHSSPVHDGKIAWLTTATTDGTQLQACAIDLETGNLRRELTIFEPQDIEKIHQDNSYASPTPVMGDGRLFVHYGTYGTASVDCETGEIIWKNTNFPVEHQGGPGSSPVLYEDLVILTLDGAQQQRLVALDAENGSLRWETKRSAPFRPSPITRRAFSTPLLHVYNGQTQLISPGADQCHAYDPSTGEEIWHVTYTGFSNVPAPVAVNDVVLFTTGFFKPELWAVLLDGTGDVTSTHKTWSFPSGVPDVPSPIIIDHQAIMASDHGIVTSIDVRTGDKLWALRIGGNISASPIYANGRLYFCSEEGVTKIVDPHADKPHLVQANRLDGQIMASPAVIGNDLLIRTTKALYRITR